MPPEQLAHFGDLAGKLGHDGEEEVGKGGDWERKKKVLHPPT